MARKTQEQVELIKTKRNLKYNRINMKTLTVEQKKTYQSQMIKCKLKGSES